MDPVSVAVNTVKFLSVCQNQVTFIQVLKTAPDSVVKVICNAALNALKGDVGLSEDTRDHLHKYRRAIIVLTSKTVSLARKRNLLQSKSKLIGGFHFVPTLLTATLNSLGDRLFED
jgi:hypothetical protein